MRDQQDDSPHLEAGSLGAVIFDMDGVLIDTPKIHRQVWLDFAANAPWAEVRNYKSTSAGRRSRDVLDELVSHRISAEKIDDIVTSLHKDFLRRCRGEDLIFPAMRYAVEQLKGQVPIALATSAPRYVAREMLGDVYDLFDAAVTSDECKKGKPDPEVYSRARALLKDVKASPLAVEDTTIGVKSALAAGCTTWAFTPNPIVASDALRAGASVIVSDVSDLANLIVRSCAR